MKKILLAIITLCVISNTIQAQPHPGFRKLRPNETAYLNNLYASLYSSIPHSYKNWTVVGDPQTFSISEFWCQDVPDGVDCINDCPESLGKSEPYTLSCYEDFTMDGSESGSLMVAAVSGITDYNNASQIATTLKGTAKSKIAIRIYANLDGAEQILSYCGKTPPQQISLPVPAALALKGVRSPACPILSSGRADMSGDYYDNAVIILGKPVVFRKNEHTDDGLSDTRYTPGFDHSKIGTTTTQNIIITIKGDSDDIDAIVGMIDWVKLNNLIGK
jgi:hypothetical protein